MAEKLVRYFIILIFAFIAELIDGGLGMGYGVSLTTFLLSIGLGTAVASAAVHISEIFTTLASGISHFKLGNFDKKIFSYLSISGVIGGVAGSIAAVKFQNFSLIRPFVSGILLVMGALIIVKYLGRKQAAEYKTPSRKKLIPLGFVAAFIDAIGGGGWGPISTPTLIVTNTHPKKSIGSVNFAEFFVTLAISITFFVMLTKIEWAVIIPMIIGGVIAAPIAAILTKRLPHKIVGISVGFLIILLSTRTILKSIGIGFFF